MTGVVQSPLNAEQVYVWLRGLLTIAWADGHFDQEEKDLIAELTQEELAPSINLGELEPIKPKDLAEVLGNEPIIAENFLRTAVMVALADGVYSASEEEKLYEFCHALGQNSKVLEALRHTLWDGRNSQFNDSEATTSAEGSGAVSLHPGPTQQGDVLSPVRHWLDDLEIHDPRLAKFLCKMIPPQCPFERDIHLFGKKVVHIPPLCHINPLYEQMVGLRFRALSYLADECGEDVTPYCQ